LAKPVWAFQPTVFMAASSQIFDFVFIFIFLKAKLRIWRCFVMF
jgi:hypothetical protein